MPNLFDDHPEVVAEMTRRERQSTKAREQALGPGPIYQGVSKQLRRLTSSGTYKHLEQIVDPDEHAGTIALCRQLARAVDHFTGHNATGWRANGRDLAPLVEQLRLALESLRPEASESDEFQEFMADLNKLPETTP